MKTFLKAFIAIALVAGSFSMCGCRTECCSDCTATHQSMSSGFNSETYIWESFLFPTNRTDK